MKLVLAAPDSFLPVACSSQKGCNPSATHFFVKLFFAAPASFFSSDVASQPSRTHFLVKLFFAAPDSFFSAACAIQALSAANAGEDRRRALRRAIRVFTEYLSKVWMLCREIIVETGIGRVTAIDPIRPYRAVMIQRQVDHSLHDSLSSSVSTLTGVCKTGGKSNAGCCWKVRMRQIAAVKYSDKPAQFHF